MFSENRSLASKVFRALFVTCVSTALGSLAPAFGQSLPSADLPGLIDALIDPPPATGAFAYNSFVPSLTPGTSYIDPVFGSTVKRVTTDHGKDDIYASNMHWNADGTRYLHRVCCTSDYWKVIDTTTGQVTHTNVPDGALSADGGFDPVDPNVLYYMTGSQIHKVTLQSGGTWTDVVYFTAPGGAAIKSLGGTINWLDASGRYMVVRYGAEPSVYVYDRQNLAAGPYANPVNGAATADSNGYVGLSPDGQFIVGYEDSVGPVGGSALSGSQGVSWRIDHANRSVAAAQNIFWSLCGDHGSFVSASDGRNYMVTDNCYDSPEVWRVDITNNAQGLGFAQQKALPNNRRLLTQTWSDGNHFSTIAKGALKDWMFMSTEDTSDAFNGPVSPWRVYRQEIIAINVMTGEIRRLAHHRSRGQGADYYYQNRISASWGGEMIGWASNFNQSGVVDVYAVQFSVTSDTTPPTVSISAPVNGATVSGSAVTVSASASDNVGVSGVQFKLDGANLGAEVTAAPYSTTWNTTLAANGSHTLTAVARDAAGNTATSAAVSVTVANDTTPPVISLASASNISSAAATITWATNEASDSQVEYGLTTAYGSATPLNSSLLTAHAVTLTGLLANTPYHYRVKSRDAAGNLATSADFTLTTLVDITPPPVLDTVPPSIPTGLTATAASTSQINLTWPASADNVGVAGYQVFRGGVKVTTVTATSYSDAGLSAGTTYSYTVAAYDGAGNVSAQSAAATAVTLPAAAFRQSRGCLFLR